MRYSKAKKFALYFIKMVLKDDLYDRAVARFKQLVKNPEQKELLTQIVTYDSFKAKMVNDSIRSIDLGGDLWHTES